MRGRDLERPFRGVRAAAMPVSQIERCEAYAPRLRATDAFSHETAAALWEMPIADPADPDTIHVSSVGGTRPRIPGVAGHELSDRRVRIATRHGLPVVDPATAWRQLVGRVSVEELIVAGDHLVFTPRRSGDEPDRPFSTVTALAVRLRGYNGRGRRDALIALDLIRDGAASRRETLLRLALIRSGLPEPVLQQRITDDDGGFVGFGDLVYPGFKILVEYDGQQHRTDSRQYHRDIIRHDTLVDTGWLRIRTDKHTPESGPSSAPERTRAALLRRGWRP